MDGFEIYFLGINTPAKELARFSAEKKADIVGVSVTIEKHVPNLEEALKELRALSKPPKIIVGGPKELTHWKGVRSLAPDGIATDAPAAVAACRKVLGLPGSSRSLAQYLRGLGGRIQGSRRALNMSQQELADSSGLDRAYISSLENGKQNVTVGAVLKIAEALDIPIDEILIDAQSPGFR
jgi:DNA-binding XRE family transcriptional regulator